MNKEQEALLHEYFQKRADIHEEMLWIGCNPSDPEIFKKQSEEGFKKMYELNELGREYQKKIEDAKVTYCNECKFYCCYDDGDGRYDVWCDSPDLTYKEYGEFDLIYKDPEHCPYYEEEDPILDIKRKTEPMGSGND